MDGSPPGSPVHGILQAVILEWVAISSSRESSQSRDQTWVSYDFCTAGGFLTIGVTREAPQSEHHRWKQTMQVALPFLWSSPFGESTLFLQKPFTVHPWSTTKGPSSHFEQYISAPHHGSIWLGQCWALDPWWPIRASLPDIWNWD